MCNNNNIIFFRKKIKCPYFIIGTSVFLCATIFLLLRNNSNIFEKLLTGTTNHSNVYFQSKSNTSSYSLNRSTAEKPISTSACLKSTTTTAKKIVSTSNILQENVACSFGHGRLGNQVRTRPVFDQFHTARPNF